MQVEHSSPVRKRKRDRHRAPQVRSSRERPLSARARAYYSPPLHAIKSVSSVAPLTFIFNTRRARCDGAFMFESRVVLYLRFPTWTRFYRAPHRGPPVYRHRVPSGFIISRGLNSRIYARACRRIQLIPQSKPPSGCPFGNVIRMRPSVIPSLSLSDT